MNEEQLIYPVNRLLANPRVFNAIANFLDGPNAEVIREAFYELLEYSFNEYEDAEDCEFEAEEVCFKSTNGGEQFDIILDSGLASTLQAIEGETRAFITNDNEMAATSAIYKRLVTAIEEAHPELAGNIALCSPPTPGNSYLRSEDGEYFQGSFHLLTDPDTVFAFNVDIVDVPTDKLIATIQRM